MNRRKKSLSNWIFDSIVHLVLIGAAVVTIVPFLQVVTISLSPPEVASAYGLHLFPVEIDLSGYKSILEYETIWTSYWNTMVRTVVGTLLSMFLYIIGAYPLSRKYLPHKKFWTIVCDLYHVFFRRHDSKLSFD